MDGLKCRNDLFLQILVAALVAEIAPLATPKQLYSNLDCSCSQSSACIPQPHSTRTIHVRLTSFIQVVVVLESGVEPIL